MVDDVNLYRKQSVIKLTVGQQVAALEARDAVVSRLNQMTHFTHPSEEIFTIPSPISSRAIERILSRRFDLHALPRCA